MSALNYQKCSYGSCISLDKLSQSLVQIVAVYFSGRIRIQIVEEVYNVGSVQNMIEILIYFDEFALIDSSVCVVVVKSEKLANRCEFLSDFAIERPQCPPFKLVFSLISPVDMTLNKLYKLSIIKNFLMMAICNFNQL